MINTIQNLYKMVYYTTSKTNVINVNIIRALYAIVETLETLDFPALSTENITVRMEQD